MAGIGRAVRPHRATLGPDGRTRWRFVMDPSPDYDATDEIEYFFNWLPWALRGTDWTQTPAYPPV